MERNCIIMAPVPILIKEWKRAVSRNPNYQFYDVAQPGEFSQLIGVLESSIIFVTDIKVCKEILVKNKRYTRSKKHRVVLINDKQIPMRIFQKFQKVGLDEHLGFKTPLKTLNFKVDIFFKNLEKEEQQKEKELKRKKLKGKKIDQSQNDELTIKSLKKSDEEVIKTQKEADQLSRPSHWEGKDREDKHLQHDPLKGKVYFGEEEIDGTLEGLAPTEHRESEELGLDQETEEIDKNWSGHDLSDNTINHENLEMDVDPEDESDPLDYSIENEIDGSNLEMDADNERIEHSHLEMRNSSDDFSDNMDHLDENEMLDNTFEGIDLSDLDIDEEDENLDGDEIESEEGEDKELADADNLETEESYQDDQFLGEEEVSDEESTVDEIGLNEVDEESDNFDHLNESDEQSEDEKAEESLDYLEKREKVQAEVDWEYPEKEKKDYSDEESFYEKDDVLLGVIADEESPELNKSKKENDYSDQSEHYDFEDIENKRLLTDEEKFEEAVELLRAEDLDLQMNDHEAGELAEIIFEIEEEAKDVRSEQYQELKEDVITYEEIDFDIAEQTDSISKLDESEERNEEYENFFNLSDSDNLVEYQFNFLEQIENEELREETANIFDIPQKEFIPQSLFHFDYLYFIHELFKIRAEGAEQKILQFTRTYFIKKNSEYFNYFEIDQDENIQALIDAENDPIMQSDLFENCSKQNIQWDLMVKSEKLNPEARFLYFPYFAEKLLVGALVFGYAQEIPHDEKVKMEALFLTTRCFFC